MKVSHWGKSHWTTHFSIALDFPETPGIGEQFHYKRYYTEIQYVTPCKTCRKHYRSILKKLPINPYLNSRRSLVTWVLKIHNMINEDRGLAPLTEGQAMRKYFPNMTTAEARMLGVELDPAGSQKGGGEGNLVVPGVALIAAGIGGYFLWKKIRG